MTSLKQNDRPLAQRITVEPTISAFDEEGMSYRVRDKITVCCVVCGNHFGTSVCSERMKKKPWHCRSCAYKGTLRGFNAGIVVFSLPRLGDYHVNFKSCGLFSVSGEKIDGSLSVTLPCKVCGDKNETSENIERHRDVEERYLCRMCRKMLWDERSPRLHRKRTFICLSCDVEYDTTLAHEISQDKDGRGRCKKCRGICRRNPIRAKLEPDVLCQVSSDALIDWETLRAYNKDTRTELLAYDKIEAICKRCNASYPTKMGYERLKVHPGFCKSCTGILGQEDPNIRRQISEKLKSYYEVNPPPPRGGRQIATENCEGNPILLRSGFEHRFVEHLRDRGLTWSYEPQGFSLTIIENGEEIVTNYWPDFYVRELDLWVEIKGYLYPRGEMKWRAFETQYSTLKKVMLFSEQLVKLEKGEITLEQLCVL